MKLSDKSKKILDKTCKVLISILMAFMIFIIIFTFFATLTFDKNKRSFCGYRFYIVKSDSMSKSENNANEKVKFSSGDIIISKIVKDKTKFKIGDVISFQSLNTDTFGETVTHQIKDYKYNSEGELVGYITFGTNTGAVDEAIVEPEFILGKYSGKIAKLGYFFNFLKSKTGYFVCILLPFLIIIIYQSVNCVLLLKKYKKQKQIESQKSDNGGVNEKTAEEMKREIEDLKNQLAQINQTQNDGKSLEDLVEENSEEDVEKETIKSEANENDKIETSDTQIDDSENELIEIEEKKTELKTNSDDIKK